MSKYDNELFVDKNIDFIEADVVNGHILGNPNSDVLLPVMSHPPSQSSDLSLEAFLDAIIGSQRPKGIKLDFKDMEVVESAFKIIETRKNTVGNMGLIIRYRMYLFTNSIYCGIIVHWND